MIKNFKYSTSRNYRLDMKCVYCHNYKAYKDNTKFNQTERVKKGSRGN